MASEDPFDVLGGDDIRVQVFSETQDLLLKKSDLTLEKLSHVFKITPSSMFLQEDVTKNIEFPSEDRFRVSYGRYRILGDSTVKEPTESLSHERSGPSNTSKWSLSRPWASNSFLGTRRTDSASSFWKRSISYVALALDHTDRNIVIESNIDNVYIKIPENSVSVRAILSALGAKIMCAADELIVLDAKFMEITDDKDMDYWKTPSRKIYCSRKSEYEDIIKVKARKRLSLNKRKRPSILYSDLSTTEEDSEPAIISRLEHKIDKIEGDLTKYVEEVEIVKRFKSSKEEACKVLECKICKCLSNGGTPILFMLCCNQILGCQSCYNIWSRENRTCPLCRADSPPNTVINGIEPVYSYFSAI